MRLCMMPVSIFVSRLGKYINLNYKIKIYSNLKKKKFYFEIYIIFFIFKSSI